MTPRPPADAGGAEALVRAAAAGDRASFAALYERFASTVHGILLAHGRTEDAADGVQEVFLRALDRLHTLRDAAAFPGWLAAIARNHARMALRGSRRLVPLDDRIPAPERPALEAREVMDALRALPEAYREPLVLRLVEGLSGEEIAARTGLTPGSVRVNLHRGMRLLRERLGAYDD